MIRSAALVALVGAACSQRAPASSGAPAAPPPAAASAGAPVDEAYITAATSLRREPSEAARVAGPTLKPKRLVPNPIATLQRGEKVAVLETREEWARVKASDETVGWVRRGLLLPAAGVTEATLLAPADAFDRPDLLAVNAKRKIDPGTLTLVVRSRELFSEVNTSSGPNAWVLTDRLSAAPRDVSVAKLVEKARWLGRSGKADEAKSILELARREFPDSPLVEQVLARELGEAPDGGAPPAAAGAPPAPPGPAPVVNSAVPVAPRPVSN